MAATSPSSSSISGPLALLARSKDMVMAVSLVLLVVCVGVLLLLRERWLRRDLLG